MKKAMLSQPMNGKSDEEIVATRDNAIAVLTGKGFEIVNTLFTDEWHNRAQMEFRGVVQIPLCFIAKGIENMSLCHAVYFCAGWENARGCKIEHSIAEAYGLEIIYETGAEPLPFTDATPLMDPATDGLRNVPEWYGDPAQTFDPEPTPPLPEIHHPDGIPCDAISYEERQARGY